MGNNRSSARTPAEDRCDFRKWTQCEQFTIVLMWMLWVVLFATGLAALISGAVLFNTGDSANDAVDNLRKAINESVLLENECFTCDTRTGEITFKGTVDLNRTIVSSASNFFEGGVEQTKGYGLSVPGFSFLGAPPTIGVDGNSLISGDLVFAPNSGLDQVGVGLPPLTAHPDTFTLGQLPNASAVGFGPVWLRDTTVDPPTVSFKSVSTLRIGVFNTAETQQSERCRVSEITPSPTVYFLVDDSGSEAKWHLCTCVSNQGSSLGTGAGEHCTESDLVANFYGASP